MNWNYIWLYVELYAVEDNTAIEKLSDIQGTEIDAKLEIINTDNESFSVHSITVAY